MVCRYHCAPQGNSQTVSACIEIIFEDMVSQSDMDIRAVPAYISKYALFGVFWYSAFDKSDIELFTSFFHHYFHPWLDILVTDDNFLQFEFTNTICQQHGMTHTLFEVDIHDLVTIHQVLQYSASFHSHLHHSGKESSLTGKVTLECMKLKHTGLSLEPTGNNLNINGVIFVDADMHTEYGYKIANITSVPLYTLMFFLLLVFWTFVCGPVNLHSLLH